MLSRDRAGEEEALLRHDPELAAQRLLRHVAQVDAVDRDRARRSGRRSARAASRSSTCRRRCGRRARPSCPAGTSRSIPCSTSAPVPYVKRTSSKWTWPRMRASVVGAAAVGHLGLLDEHVHDLVQRGDGREERAVELRELLHRVEEVRQVAEERGEHADRHVCRRRRGSRRSRARSRSRATRAGRRTGSRGRSGRPSRWLRRAVGLADRAEVLVRRALARERLQDAHAGDVLGERRRDVAQRLADAAVAARRLLAEDRRRDGQRRDDGERREREPPVEDEQDHRGADERQRVLDRAT